MKNLLYILFAIILFSSCSSDDDKEDKPKTTVTIENKSGEYVNILLAYKVDGIYKRIGTIEPLPIGSKQSKTLYVDLPNKLELYLFTDYLSFSTYWRRLDTTYIVEPSHMNIIEIPSELNISNLKPADVTDNTQFPK